MPALQKLLIIGVFLAVIWNLFAALYYMATDKGGQTGRTARSLTWRIGLSVGLILFVALGIWMGWIQPHGIER